MRIPTSTSVPVFGLLLTAVAAVAAPVYQPPGANLTFGDVTHGLRALSAAGNPAAATADAVRTSETDAERRGGIVFSTVAGIEFGNIDRYFELVDEVAAGNKPSEPPGPPTPENPIYKPGGGISIGDIIDVCCPDLSEVVDRIERQVKERVALLALMKWDAYAKTFESIDLPVVLGKEVAGGAWTFNVNLSRSSKSYSYVDTRIDFSPDAALQALSEQYDLMPGDPETLFELPGDVDLIVDPRIGSARIIFDNDSTIVTKASRTSEFSVGYGRPFTFAGGSDLFIGAELSYYDLKLSRAIVRYGDITDTEEIFDSIRDADYTGDRGFGLDLGLLWVRDRFQLGASWMNVNEPEFVYPAADLSGYRSEEVINQLIKDRTYVMEHQMKLEASLFTEDRKWSVNFGIDANDTVDPMGDPFQWMTVSGGWTTGMNWLRNARFGYRRNLVGSELTYLSAGVTAFRWLNFDLATVVDRVEIDERDIPQSLILSLGFQLDF